MTDIERLRKMVPVFLGPGSHGERFIVLQCYCDFEGHGIASETWEEHWSLELPQMQYFWRGTKGWHRGNDGVAPRFHGRSATEAISQAIEFLEWWHGAGKPT